MQKTNFMSCLIFLFHLFFFSDLLEEEGQDLHLTLDGRGFDALVPEISPGDLVHVPRIEVKEGQTENAGREVFPALRARHSVVRAQ